RQRPVRLHEVGTWSASSSASSKSVRPASVGFPGTAVVELVVATADLQPAGLSRSPLVPAPEARSALVEAVLVRTAAGRPLARSATVPITEPKTSLSRSRRSL